MLSSTSFFVLVDAEEIELHLSPREQIQIDLLTFLCYIGVFLNCFELIVQRKIIVTLDFCLFLTFLKTAGSRYGSASFRLSAKAVQSLHFAMWPCLETDNFKSSKKKSITIYRNVSAWDANKLQTRIGQGSFLYLLFKDKLWYMESDMLT